MTQQLDAVRNAVSPPPPVDLRPLRAWRRRRVLVQAACVLVTLFMVVPAYLIALAALSTRASLNDFPLAFLPTHFSTETMSFFLSATGVMPGLVNSLVVGAITLVVSLVVGTPAGYA